MNITYMSFNLSIMESLAILLAAWMFTTSPKVNAQTHEPAFKLIPGANGIAFGKINDMVRDRDGVMWFADQKNGLVRYDGTHATAFPHDTQNPNSLGGTQPESMLIDSTGIIWISFWGTGLDRFDPKTSEFKHFRYNNSDPATISNDSVSAILIDHLGNLWAGTNQGLDLFDQQTGSFKHFKNDPQDPSSLSFNLVRTLYEDREGTLWVGTGMAWETHQKGGLNKFNRSKGNFTRYLNDPKDPHSLINNKVRAIFEDSRGTFWVGTAGDGLHTMDRKTGKFTRYLNNPKNPQQLSRPPVKNEVGDHITFITEDVEGQIWIGTWSNGANRYNPATKEITYFGNGMGGLKDRQLWIAKSFSDGLFWLSTETPLNLYQIDLFTNNIPFVTIGGAEGVNTFFQDDPQTLWVGTRGGGLMKKDLKSGNIQLFKNDPANAKSLSDNNVGVLMKDKKGNFWVGTNNGLNQFDPKTATFIRYQHIEENKESITGQGILVLHEDHESNIWIGTFDGLDKFDRKTGKFTHYIHTQDPGSIGGKLIPGMLEDKPGDLWVGVWNGGGLNKLNTASGKFKHDLEGRNIGQIYKDHAGIIWVGSGNGLYRYNREKDNFSLLNENQDAGAKIEEGRTITEDDESNLWVATPSGIVKVNKERNLIIRYGQNNGVNKTIWYLSSYKTLDGQVLFGTDGGYYAFKPSALKNSPLAPTIKFYDFWIGNESISASDKQGYESFQKAKAIQLKYEQNIFSIGFSVADYSNSEFRKVIYSLEGYDLNWRQPGSEGRAYYFNVPPGKYTFKVKALNSTNSEWQQESIALIISPPWWRTWWAYGSFGIMFIGFVFSVDRFQRKRILKRAQAQAKEKELMQAREIEKAYLELKATQNQLIQSEKMASLGELTAGIAHEIQNPLNFVNNFSEVNSELITEMKEELLKGNIDEAKTIADNIDENEKKIIFHGKRADGIVKGMLQHSRSSSGVKEPTDINVLADEYLRLAYHGLRAKDKSFNATMKTEFDENIGNVNVVPQDIGRVILNLITNAFYAVTERKKLNEEGFEPTVTVSTQKAVNKVEITVTDNGNGIPQKALDKIFQPFFTTKPTGQGTGLGLSMSYDIVTNAHHGEIKVKTKEGEGTEFNVVLPL